MVESSSLFVTTLLNLVLIGIVLVEIYVLDLSCDLCDLSGAMDRSPSG